MNFEKLDPFCKQKIEEFKEENKDFLENPVVKSFLMEEKNQKLLVEVICDPTEENQKLLDNEFKKFYFDIRFTSYISMVLYFNAINFDKRYRKMLKRHPLTVDQPIKNDTSNTSFNAMLVDVETEIQVEDILRSDNIEDYITNPVLYEAIQSLTEKQKEVISLAYVKGLTDTEISKVLNKSQQAVSKIHKAALKSICKFIEKKGGLKDECM
ncbi:MAG: sigma-70 family RNA polymerase sigma factor [Anoxybacillus sp.]|nr:sigma-70 family RNA polymerase sigma factor [Anoxybacillus sp.]MCL6587906.1 sigma-70 family RNA polymerase sigma factor [Anoxybacillus sp.]